MPSQLSEKRKALIEVTRGKVAGGGGVGSRGYNILHFTDSSCVIYFGKTFQNDSSNNSGPSQQAEKLKI